MGTLIVGVQIVPIRGLRTRITTPTGQTLTNSQREDKQGTNKNSQEEKKLKKQRKKLLYSVVISKATWYKSVLESLIF